MIKEEFDIAKLIHLGNKEKAQIGRRYYGLDDINDIFNDSYDLTSTFIGIYKHFSKDNIDCPFDLESGEYGNSFAYLYPVEEGYPSKPKKQYWIYNTLTQKDEPIFDRLLGFGRTQRAEVGKEYYFGDTKEEIYNNIINDTEYSELKDILHFSEYPFLFKEKHYKLCYPRVLSVSVERNLLLNWSIFDIKDYCLKHPGKLFRYKRFGDHTYYTTISDFDVTFKQVFIAGEWEDWDNVKNKLFHNDGSIIYSFDD